MKFGALLLRSRVPEWTDHYLDYNAGKNKLKQCLKLFFAEIEKLRLEQEELQKELQPRGPSSGTTSQVSMIGGESTTTVGKKPSSPIAMAAASASMLNSLKDKESTSQHGDQEKKKVTNTAIPLHSDTSDSDDDTYTSGKKQKKRQNTSTASASATLRRAFSILSGGFGGGKDVDQQNQTGAGGPHASGSGEDLDIENNNGKIFPKAAKTKREEIERLVEEDADNLELLYECLEDFYGYLGEEMQKVDKHYIRTMSALANRLEEIRNTFAATSSGAGNQQGDSTPGTTTSAGAASGVAKVDSSGNIKRAMSNESQSSDVGLDLQGYVKLMDAEDGANTSTGGLVHHHQQLELPEKLEVLNEDQLLEDESPDMLKSSLRMWTTTTTRQPTGASSTTPRSASGASATSASRVGTSSITLGTNTRKFKETLRATIVPEGTGSRSGLLTKLMTSGVGVAGTTTSSREIVDSGEEEQDGERDTERRSGSVVEKNTTSGAPAEETTVVEMSNTGVEVLDQPRLSTQVSLASTPSNTAKNNEQQQPHNSASASTKKDHKGAAEKEKQRQQQQQQRQVSRQQVDLILFRIVKDIKKLEDFCRLNYSGYRKLMKKHDKKTSLNTLATVLPFLAENYIFPNYQSRLQLLQEEVVLLAEQFGSVSVDDYWKFDTSFSGGMGINYGSTNTFRFGTGYLLAFFLGVVFMALLDLGVLVDLPATNPNFNVDHFFDVFPLFRFCFMFILLLWLLGWVLSLYEEYAINYIFLLDIDPKCQIRATDFFGYAAIQTILWVAFFGGYVFFCKFSMYGAGADRSEKVVDPQFFPICLMISQILFLFLPSDSFRRKYRWQILELIRDVMCAPFVLVTFGANIVGDILTSFVKPLSDLEYTYCYLLYIVSFDTGEVEDFGEAKLESSSSTTRASQLADTTSAHVRIKHDVELDQVALHQEHCKEISGLLLPFVLALPYYFRLMQCVARFRATRDAEWEKLLAIQAVADAEQENAELARKEAEAAAGGNDDVENADKTTPLVHSPSRRLSTSSVSSSGDLKRSAFAKRGKSGSTQTASAAHHGTSTSAHNRQTITGSSVDLAITTSILDRPSTTPGVGPNVADEELPATIAHEQHEHGSGKQVQSSKTAPTLPPFYKSPHFWNAGKYCTGILVVFQQYLTDDWRVWLVISAVSTCYMLTWDMYMDWNLVWNPIPYLRYQFFKFLHKNYQLLKPILKFLGLQSLVAGGGNNNKAGNIAGGLQDSSTQDRNSSRENINSMTMSNRATIGIHHALEHANTTLHEPLLGANTKHHKQFNKDKVLIHERASEIHEKHRFEHVAPDRTKLYPEHYYLWIPVLNFFLRFTWILTIVPTPAYLLQAYFFADSSGGASNTDSTSQPVVASLSVSENLIIFLAAAGEIYRRAQWALLRLENEHLTNASHYRAFCWVPPVHATPSGGKLFNSGNVKI
ncbi:unnamed protein product [Amoebophrya sp. A120]|nr:unnamed protein product [Amoebophrya sp. A120]|eukprot:GSA120T00004669001.1